MQPVSNKGNTSADLLDLIGCQKFTPGTASPRRNPFTLQAINPHDLRHSVQSLTDQLSLGKFTAQQAPEHITSAEDSSTIRRNITRRKIYRSRVPVASRLDEEI